MNIYVSLTAIQSNVFVHPVGLARFENISRYNFSFTLNRIGP